MHARGSARPSQAPNLLQSEVAFARPSFFLQLPLVFCRQVLVTFALVRLAFSLQVLRERALRVHSG
jgi:hypothetical protein